MLSHMTHRARQLRRHATPAERRLWTLLRARRLCGAKFRRQAPLGPFIVDFYCPSAGLVIEADGAGHHPRPQRDEVRDAAMAAAGLTVLRFSNEEILRDEDRVLARIAEHLHSIPPRSAGSGVGGEGR